MKQTKIVNAFLDLLSKYSRADEEILGVDMSPGFIRVARLKFKNDKWSVLNLIERAIENESIFKDTTKTYASTTHLLLGLLFL